MPRLILASQSPRRKALLTRMGAVFEVIPSDFEEHLDDSRLVEEVAKELGLGKALAVAEKHPDAIVIGSDTIVALGEKQLGKPADLDEARTILRELAGREHRVITSVAIVCKAKNICIVDTDTTHVLFKPFDKNAVEQYVTTCQVLDKAGSYGIQEGAAGLVEQVRGNQDTIVGLPTGLLARHLQTLGIELKPLKITVVPAKK